MKPNMWNPPISTRTGAIVGLIIVSGAFLYRYPVQIILGVLAIWIAFMAIRFFIAGFFTSLDVKESHVLDQLRPRAPRRERGAPRGRGRRPRDYFPWEADGDDFPENLGD